MNVLYDYFLASEGVETDSRKDLQDKIFFALKGPNFNGNTFALEALYKGASYAVVDENVDAFDERLLFVEDVLQSLQQLSTMHRKALGTPILGITGSNGKTTNKELLHLVLNQKFHCYATKGNFNNQIGVPLSLLQLTEDHDFAIIEMGASKPGDIKELCEIARPDYGYITNIGVAHLEGFGSKEAIASEKGELFKFVKFGNGKIYANTSASEVVEIANNYENVILVGEDRADDYCFKHISSIPNAQFRYEDVLITSHLYGAHNYENLKMCAAIGMDLGVEIIDIKKALESYKSKNNRSEVLEKNDIHIFLDAYNANPSSMKASLKSFAEFDHNNKTLILGDMLELGGDSDSFHKEILDLVSEYEWKEVFLIGQCFKKQESSYPTFHFSEEAKLIDQTISDHIQIGDYVLVKGSRGLALEKLSFIQQQK